MWCDGDMIELSASVFERYLRKRLEDHYFRVWNELSLGALDLFWRPGGLSIGPFSKLVDLPVSRVRHYINQGLVEPYKAGLKFRFHLFSSGGCGRPTLKRFWQLDNSDTLWIGLSLRKVSPLCEGNVLCRSV